MNILQKNRVTAIVLGVCAVWFPAIRPTEAAKLPLDGYAAVVNERTITIGDVMMSIYEAEEKLRIMHGGEALEEKRDELFRSGLEKLIDQALIIEEFGSRKDMQIPDRMVDDRVNEIIFERFGNDRSALMPK